MHDYEKLGVFYLGRPYDLKQPRTTPEPLLYDSKDLTTHAVCVGMTGSGKTGLCLALLEEAAIDGIPVLAIDPKGDLGNLLLTFPELRPADFAPWVDADEAARRGLSVDEFAARTADLWRTGLAEWDQPPERIAMFANAADRAIYTPGSTAGLPLSMLGSFQAPPEVLKRDAEAYQDRIDSAVSGLLALLGDTADPLTSREHILLANIFDSVWKQGSDLSLEDLIHYIQDPPFDQVGVLPRDKFYPPNDRFALVVRLNNLLASPGFRTWMAGEPLDVGRLLYTEAGKPRVSILSIAHLGDNQRMAFVTLLLNEVLSWVRSQPGTSSLRAIVYMDEVFGYFPPVANPPSKKPMLTLLKQARAFGVGIVLATQNPMDLDYKGLSNTGTWFLGRLQTDRDKKRVLDGLEGASTTAGATFDRKRMDSVLSGLGSRVFVMNNVHEDAPVVFQTRWVLSYLRGPLTRAQISELMRGRRGEAADDEPATDTGEDENETAALPETGNGGGNGNRVLIPPDIDQCYVPPRRGLQPGEALEYRPALLGSARLNFVDRNAGLDHREEIALLLPADEPPPDVPWPEAEAIDPDDFEHERSPIPGARFAPPPAELTEKRSYTAWARQLGDHLYRNRTLTLWSCPALKRVSEPGESERDFRMRMSLASHELRDQRVDALRSKYGSRFRTVQEKIDRARERLEAEQTQANRSTWDFAASVGDSLLGALLGRKTKATTTVSKTARSARKVAHQRGDINAAAAALEQARQEHAQLDAEFRREVDRIEAAFTPEHIVLEPRVIRLRRKDLADVAVALAWLPWVVGPDGAAGPASR